MESKETKEFINYLAICPRCSLLFGVPIGKKQLDEMNEKLHAQSNQVLDEKTTKNGR